MPLFINPFAVAVQAAEADAEGNLPAFNRNIYIRRSMMSGFLKHTSPPPP